MKIERIDEKTVKCYLSTEDLEEFNIDYKDFILRNDKAREVVHEIFTQAAEEVGYKPPQVAFDLQIMLLPDKSLLLTFSERDPNMDDEKQFLNCLKEMKKMFHQAKEAMEKQEGLAISDEPGPVAPADKESKPEFAVFVFSSLRKVMEFAAILPANLRVESALYLHEGYYYLYFLKGGASYQRYSRACIQALEFAALYTAEESRAFHIKEHGECLIAEKALKHLRG